VSLFKAAQPIGARASGIEGRSPFRPIHDFGRVDEYAAEYEKFVNNELDPQMQPTEAAVLKEVLHALIAKARCGRVGFESPQQDGKILDSSQFVYELRPELRTAFARPRRKLRLYCAEPADVSRLILGLHLATKPGDRPDIQGEQRTAIREAEHRADAWEMARLRRDS
jgi:hypothetical protein